MQLEYKSLYKSQLMKRSDHNASQMSPESLQVYESLGRRLLQKQYEDLGIGYMYREMREDGDGKENNGGTLDAVGVVDLLKHAEGLARFMRMLEQFLGNFH